MRSYILSRTGSVIIPGISEISEIIQISQIRNVETSKCIYDRRPKRLTFELASLYPERG